jgi:exodeoxyribonuclease-1
MAFDYALTLRDKRAVWALLDKGEPLVHASARFSAALGCIAPVMPVAPHPTNANGVICLDLRADPNLLLDLSVDELRMRLFTPANDLPEGTARIPLKTVHVNRAPVLAPMTTLSAAAAARWSIDPGQVARHAQTIRDSAAAIRERVQAAHQVSPDDARERAQTDPDLMIYSGGFLSDADRRTLERLRRLAPAELAQGGFHFADPRLPQLLFRYRARNWPETLSPPEREQWDALRLARLTDPDGGGSIDLDHYEECLAALAQTHAADPAKLHLIEELAAWAECLMDAGD